MAADDDPDLSAYAMTLEILVKDRDIHTAIILRGDVGTVQLLMEDREQLAYERYKAIRRDINTRRLNPASRHVHIERRRPKQETADGLE